MSEETKNGKRKKNKSLGVVGIGSSAEGLEPLETFFNNVPEKSGFSYIIVRHMPANYKSSIIDILNNCSKMPCLSIKEDEKSAVLTPDTIYIAPPRKRLTIKNGAIIVGDLTEKEENYPINAIFKGLAKLKERAIGVILSGAGYDGAEGIEAIKAAGGMTFVQEPESAKYNSMPLSSIATGKVDYILLPEEIPSKLFEVFEKEDFDIHNIVKEPEEIKHLEDMWQILLETTGINFSVYKSATLQRRVERRMQMNKIESVSEYIDILKNSKDECELIKSELLIGVTSFFRDKEAYEILKEKVMPELFANSPNGIRCWVAGCSTGEEAYSLAMLIREFLIAAGKNTTALIFATDIDADAVKFAGKGLYPASIEDEIPSEYLTKYFIKQGKSYQVGKEIRDMIIFARHNVIADPPFNRLDLLMCRNLLIYIAPESQKKVISLFQFALKTEGCMMLGPSETLGDFIDNFKAINHRWKIYRYSGEPRTSLINHISARDPLPNIYVPPKREIDRHHSMNRSAIEGVKSAIIESFVPPCIIVNELEQPIIIFGDINKYINIPKGEMNFSILSLLKKEFSVSVTAAIQKIKTDAEPEPKEIPFFSGEGKDLLLNIKVMPYNYEPTGQKYIAIFFETKGNIIPDGSLTLSVDALINERVRSLEEEIVKANTSQQLTKEELESTNEELHATNEELLSSNEEFQTMNEELQSVNEELVSVNAEYQNKIRQLMELNEDMDNFLTNSDVATIFLDRNLTIRKFTPGVTRAFNILNSDMGRSIQDLTPRLEYENIIDDIKNVLITGTPIEKDVHSKDGAWFLIRMRPFRKEDKTSDGIVIMLIDITDKKYYEQAVIENANIYKTMFHNLPHGITYTRTILDDKGNPADHQYLFINEYLYNFCKDTYAEEYQEGGMESIIGKKLSQIYSPAAFAKYKKWLHAIETAGMAGSPSTFEFYDDIKGAWFRVKSFRHKPLHVISVFEDITDVKVNEADYIKQNEEIQKIVKLRTQELLRVNEQQAKTEVKLTNLNKQKDQLFTIIAHDLKSPFNSLLGFTEYIADYIDDLTKSEIKEYIGNLNKSARSVFNLLENLLYWSRVQTGRAEYQPEKLKLREFIEDILTLYKFTADQKEIKLISNLDFDPEVYCDKSMIETVIRNLISNAVKFTPNGGAVTVNAEKLDDKIKISVADTGLGIEKEDMNKLFKNGTHFTTRGTDNEKGTGLGLMLSKELIEKNGGEIFAQSEPGKGSIFSFMLPLTSEMAHK